MSDPQQHLDDRAAPIRTHLVDEPTGGKGLQGKEASKFLRLLRPVLRAGKSLKEAAKESKKNT